jgi:hypothetical protein
MDKPGEWRRRAAKLRRAAREETDPDERSTLLLLAEDCEQIAVRCARAEAA